jgi:hypothetical protein
VFCREWVGGSGSSGSVSGVCGQSSCCQTFQPAASLLACRPACMHAGKRALLAIARALVQRSDQCNPQEVSNSGEQAGRQAGRQWSSWMARTAVVHSRLHALASACSARLSSCPASPPKGTCRSFVLSLIPATPLLPACLPAVWAFAKLGHYDGPLMTTMTAEATRRIDEFRWASSAALQPSSHWGFSCARCPALARCGFLRQVHGWPSAPERLSLLLSNPSCPPPWSPCSQQNLSNLAWAFAKLAHLDEELMTAVAGAVQWVGLGGVGWRRERSIAVAGSGCFP